MPRILNATAQTHLGDREWLYTKHCIQLFSIGDIAKELGCTPASVVKFLRLFDIASPPQQVLREAAVKRKYGVPNVGILTRSQAQETMIKRYGGHNWSNAAGRERRDATCLERYGNANVAKTDYATNKARNTNITKYGRDSKKTLHLSDDIMCKLTDREWMYDQHVVQQKSVVHISTELGFCKNTPTNTKTVTRYLAKHNIPVQQFQTSMAEKQILDYIGTMYKGEILSNVRSIISPLELDIYIPALNLAIEYCGLYWHSEEAGKDNRYHLIKLEKCNARGIRLITIFEDEWIHTPAIVQSKLATLLGCAPATKIFARKCKVSTVTVHDKRKFFEEYHIQGDGPGSITYALHHDSVVVAMMTVIKKTRGIYVLNRYATSCRVLGGFSKLLAHFERENNWVEIVSFADRRWSDGGVYTTLGFCLDKTLPPDYQYIKGTTRIHKFNYRHTQMKHKLPNYDCTLSESQNMTNHGIMKIWNCGLLRFVKHNNN